MSRVKNDINYLKMSAQLGWTAVEGDSKSANYWSGCIVKSIYCSMCDLIGLYMSDFIFCSCPLSRGIQSIHAAGVASKR